jgi:hypothetical protein
MLTAESSHVQPTETLSARANAGNASTANRRTRLNRTIRDRFMGFPLRYPGPHPCDWQLVFPGSIAALPVAAASLRRVNDFRRTREQSSRVLVTYLMRCGWEWASST